MASNILQYFSNYYHTTVCLRINFDIQNKLVMKYLPSTRN